MVQKSEMKLMTELRVRSTLRGQPGELPITCAYRVIAGSTVREFYTSSLVDRDVSKQNDVE